MIEPVTALIPLKKHSERVPHKNIRPLCGRPLFHWVTMALSASKYVREVVIDTDCEQIAADAAGNFDVTILMRPTRLHGDMVGITPLIEFELSEVGGEHFLQTHSTNPLLTTATIDRGIEALAAGPEHDSLFSVTPLRTRMYWQDGRPVNHDPENMLRTQDLPPVLEENSNIYLFTRTSFERANHRIGTNPIMLHMDPREAIDIDDESDFLLAEYLMARRLEQQSACA